MPDSARFFEVVRGLIHSAVKWRRRAFSRCGLRRKVLLSYGRKVRRTPPFGLKQLWDEVGKIFEVDILCGTP